MMMKCNDPGVDPMMFFDKALEGERVQMLTELANAASETYMAVKQAKKLGEDGMAAMVRLTQIWCTMNNISRSVVFEGGPADALSWLVAQIYDRLLQQPCRDSDGLALYVELRYMMDSLAQGRWYE